jgi:hypothetical protein
MKDKHMVAATLTAALFSGMDKSFVVGQAHVKKSGHWRVVYEEYKNFLQMLEADERALESDKAR